MTQSLTDEQSRATIAAALAQQGIQLPQPAAPTASASAPATPFPSNLDQGGLDDTRIPNLNDAQRSKLRQLMAQQGPAAPEAPAPPSMQDVARPPGQGAPGGGAAAGPAGPATAPTQTIPQHWQQTRDPGSQALMDLAFGNVTQGIEKAADPEVTPGAKATWGSMGDQPGMRASEALAQGQERAYAADSVQAWQDKLERYKAGKEVEDQERDLTSRRLSLAQQKLDPKGELSRLSPAARIGMALGEAIASGLGAYGAGMTHTENMAAKIIANSHEQAIAAQKYNIEKAQREYDDMREALREKQKILAGMPDQQAKQRAESLNRMLSQLDSIKTRAAGAAEEGQAQQKLGLAQEHFAEQNAAGMKFQPAQTIGGGPAGPVSDVKPDEIISLPGGKHVAIPDAKAREEVRSKIDVANQVRDALPKIEKLASLPATYRLTHPNEWRREYEAATKVFTSPEIQSGGGKGGLGVFKAFSNPVKPTFEFFTPGVIQAARTIADAKDQEARDLIARSGGRYVTPKDAPNKKGEIERKFVLDPTAADVSDKDAVSRQAGGLNVGSFKPIGR